MHGINKELMNVPCLLVNNVQKRKRQGTLVIKIHTLKIIRFVYQNRIFLFVCFSFNKFVLQYNQTNIHKRDALSLKNHLEVL